MQVENGPKYRPDIYTVRPNFTLPAFSAFSEFRAHAARKNVSNIPTGRCTPSANSSEIHPLR
jgi:hypothetical protein